MGTFVILEVNVASSFLRVHFDQFYRSPSGALLGLEVIADGVVSDTVSEIFNQQTVGHLQPLDLQLVVVQLFLGAVRQQCL